MEPMEWIFSQMQPDQIDEVVLLSQKWEAENITYGLAANRAEDLDLLSVWTCAYQGHVIAYLSGSEQFSENMCVFPPNTRYFEVEELYVDPEWRSKGVGSQLFRYAEQQIKQRNIEYILLSSATKDYQKIIRFYTRMGLDMWTMAFYKKL